MPAVLLFYAILGPPELSVTIGTLVFHVYRFVLILAIPIIYHRLSTGWTRFDVADLFPMFLGLWMPVVTFLHYDMARALQTGGVSSLDFVLSYLVGRVSIRNSDDLRAFLRLIAPGLAVAGLLVVMESLSRTYFVRPALTNLGLHMVSPVQVTAGSFRMGLLRGTGLFLHPIHASLILAFFLPLYVMAGRLRGARNWGLVGSLSNFFALSSSGMLVMVLSIGLMLYHVAQRRARELSWRMFLWLLAAACVIIQVGSQGGLISIVFRYLTFDPATGYYRTLIWAFGSADVARHPLIGLGFEGFTRPAWMTSSSVDAHWLLVALQFGLPASIALVALSVWAVWRATRGASSRLLPRADRDLYVALAIAMGTTVLSLATVALWSQAYSWYMMIVGICISACSARAIAPKRAFMPVPAPAQAQTPAPRDPFQARA